MKEKRNIFKMKFVFTVFRFYRVHFSRAEGGNLRSLKIVYESPIDLQFNYHNNQVIDAMCHIFQYQDESSEIKARI